MGNKSIQERTEKLKALQIVQRNLSTDDAEYAMKLRNVNKAMEDLKKQNAEALSSGIQLQKANNSLAESFKNLGKRVLFYTGLGALTGFAKVLWTLEVSMNYLNVRLVLYLVTLKRFSDISGTTRISIKISIYRIGFGWCYETACCL